MRGGEESGTGVADKRMTKDAEGAGGVAETSGDVVRGAAVNEEGTQSFVLPVQGFFGGQKEARLTGLCYPISRTVRHTSIMLHQHPNVNILCGCG